MGALVLLTVSRLFEKHLIGGSAGILMSIQTAGQIAGAILLVLVCAGLLGPLVLSLAVLAGVQLPDYLGKMADNDVPKQGKAGDSE